MEVVVRFAGGPLDGSRAYTDTLDEGKIFFNQRDEQVFLYTKIDELVYVYRPEESKGLTEKYESTLAFFAPKEVASLSFIEVDGEDEDEHE